MRRFIKVCIVFGAWSLLWTAISIVAVGELKVRPIRTNLIHQGTIGGHMQSRLDEVEIFGEVDILCLGSSLCYRGIDPRVFRKKGVPIFNLGSSAQTPHQAEILLSESLPKLSPKLILYDISPGSFYEGIESTLDLIPYRSVDQKIIELALRQNNLSIYVTLLYRWYEDKVKKFKRSPEPKKILTDTYVSGGYVERDIDRWLPQEISDREWKVSESQLESLNRIIEICSTQNIKMVFVRAPITNARYNAYQNNEMVDSLLHTFGTYIPFQNKIELVDSVHFYDQNHLNQEGVEIYNEVLFQELERLDPWELR